MICKAFGMIGLSQRAGKCLSGSDQCEKAARSGKASLLLVAQDTARGTREKMELACRAGNVPLKITPPGLGEAIGKPGRMVCAITDSGMAARIAQLLDMESSSGCVENAGV